MIKTKHWWSLLLTGLLWLQGMGWSWAESNSIQPYLDRVIKDIHQVHLDNGMTFLILENHTAPVISFITYADVGGINEPDGKTGVAHFLEHLAFKGTSRIGTTDYSSEKKVLDQLDQVFEQLKTAKQSGDQKKIEPLQKQFDELENQANEYVIQNQFGRIVEANGGKNLNAATSADYTMYFYNFPSNKLELWMSLESERFLDPVYREFYKEQQVILEERRMRTENSPIGQMVESFLDTAFTKHPYKRPVIGYNQDIQNLEPQDVKAFFKAHYSPDRLTFAIVGDVDCEQVKSLINTYFGRFPKEPKQVENLPIEPPQKETKEINLQLVSQPWYLEGYHCPSLKDKDYVVYEMISGLMSDGRTSRLYKSLVEEQQVALDAQGFIGFPGDKYPNLMLFYAMTSPNSTLEEVAKALHSEIAKLSTELVAQEELDRIKTKAKAGLLRTLNSNMGMARLLAMYQGKTGDWRNVFKELEDIDKITPADVQRVARQTFIPENKTIGRIIPAES